MSPIHFYISGSLHFICVRPFSKFLNNTSGQSQFDVILSLFVSHTHADSNILLWQNYLLKKISFEKLRDTLTSVTKCPTGRVEGSFPCVTWLFSIYELHFFPFEPVFESLWMLVYYNQLLSHSFCSFCQTHFSPKKMNVSNVFQCQIYLFIALLGFVRVKAARRIPRFI